MGKRFGGKQGSKKRQRAPDKFHGGRGRVRQASKKGRTEEQVARSLSPSSEGESSEEQFLEEVVCREPSMYDNLLTKLGSSSKSLADVYKRRQRREEGNSDTEEEDEDEDEDDGSESLGVSEEQDDDDEEHIMVGDGKQIKEAETEDESEASSTDQEHDFEVNGQTAIESSAWTSSFNEHLGHKLSETEVENLSKNKWKYEWKVPAVNMSNCKWIGTGECFLKDAAIDSDHGLKLRLYKSWLDIFKNSGGNDLHSSEQRLFFSICDSYRDILHCNKKPFYLKGREEDSVIMDAYIMHSLNHVFRTRDLVMTNKAKINQQENAQKLCISDEFRDQGFTRPKVLILLPFKSIAQRVIKRLVQLTRPAHQGNVDNEDRFDEEYGIEVVNDVDQNELQNDYDLGKPKHQKPSKPSDFQALFSGNLDDHFMIGIKFTRKSIKLYNDFYKSDMIIASPLNLITKIGHAEVDKEKDVDYLSSIEVLIIDHADVIAMQNWDHVKTVIDHLNRIPSKNNRTDIMRIREWYLDGFARFYRQTIVLGSYLNPDINALFNHHCTSYHGKVKSVCEHKGVLPKVLLQVRQIYERFDPDSIVDEDNARFEYFTSKVFPKIKDSLQGGIMLFISSYFEYVRIRNFLKSQNASFCLLGEYTKQKDISRARIWFFEGTRKIMLYTERAHFYHRYKIRGIQNLIIYSLPERKEFYPEIVNMLEGSHNMSCTVLFSRFDQLRLERIVGTAPAKRMVTSEKAVFVFC